MAQLEKMGRDMANVLRHEINEALRSVAEKHGIKIELKSGRYDDTHFAVKVDCQIIGGIAEEVEKSRFERMAEMYGAKPEWFGQEFTHGKQTLKVVGLNNKAPKNCMQLEDVNTGASYKSPPSYVAQFLN